MRRERRRPSLPDSDNITIKTIKVGQVISL
jgi:hypothetical protein